MEGLRSAAELKELAAKVQQRRAMSRIEEAALAGKFLVAIAEQLTPGTVAMLSAKGYDVEAFNGSYTWINWQ